MEEEEVEEDCGRGEWDGDWDEQEDMDDEEEDCGPGGCEWE